MNVTTQLNQVFRSYWKNPALVSDEIELTYGELYMRALGLSDWMIAQGCSKGDTVVLRLPNSWLFAVSYLACILGRFRFVPVNPDLSAQDQSYIIARVSPRLIVEDVVLLGDICPIMVEGPKFDYPRGVIAAIFFTSGTTGRPKGVCHTLEALTQNVISFNQSMGLDCKMRLYHVLPMAFMAGFLNTLWSPWMAGGAVLIGPRFRPADALHFWQRFSSWKGNAIWLTPTLAAVLVRMNRDPDIALKVGSSLKQAFCGTAPLPTVVRQTFLATFGCPLQESYGMSEVLLVSAQTRTEAMTDCHVGRLLKDIFISLRPAEGCEKSELIIHTPHALKAYLLESNEVCPLMEDGGMPSGDLGQIKEGVLVIEGRIKDLIIRGGVNVSPVMVESVIGREKGVQEVAVVGVPHDFWGELIVACIVADKGVDIGVLQSRLQQRCAVELSDGMRPDRYVWRDALPRVASGKIKKHDLIQELV
jgi:long-chain acyl-CoA synthetase